MLAFFAAVFFLIITPGPGVLSLAGVGAGFGFKKGYAYLAGLWLGNNLVALLVVSGLAAIALSVPWLRLVLLLLSTAYLLYLAARIAFAGSRIALLHSQQPPGVFGGTFLQIVNPKAYVVHTTLFLGFPFMPENLTAEVLIKFAIMNLVWIPIHFAWLWFGGALNRMALSETTQRRINIGMALAMLAVVALALVSRS